jgi:hypothetical protein
MAFLISHRYGSMDEADASSLPGLLAELDGLLDDDHPDVAVTDGESGWVLSAFQSGRLIWENPDLDEEPRHMVGVSRSEALRVMSMLAAADIDGVESLSWSPGYQ